MAAAASGRIAQFQPLDDLESSLLESWQAVTQATHRFLVLLREFDLRQGYKAYGNTDCAEWLNWKCGIARVTAQEKVRVARALWTLPQIDAAFACGDLSYSKVRALTRVAGETNETDLLDYALGVTAAQLDAYCSRLRNGDPLDSQTAARRAREGRSLTRHFREDGTGVLTVELPREELELVMQAVDRLASKLPADEDRSLFASGADALVAMAKASLLGSDGESSSSAGDAYQVVVHVDAAALAGKGGESDLPLPVIRRLCCDGGLVSMVENEKGEALNVGRKQRLVPTALKRALEARDRGCQFPGCHHDRWLDAHHIQHWADGGETSLDNLVLLCTHHHALVHEGGFRLEQSGDGSYFFARPDGRPVEISGASGVREDAPRYLVVASSAEDSVFHSTVRATVRAQFTGMGVCGRPGLRTVAKSRVFNAPVQENGEYHATRWFGQVL
jgi:hypothetical protein